MESDIYKSPVPQIYIYFLQYNHNNNNNKLIKERRCKLIKLFNILRISNLVSY